MATKEPTSAKQSDHGLAQPSSLTAGVTRSALVGDNAAGRRRVMSRVLDAFVDDIVSGRIAPGETLPNEAELTGRFGVSRTTLRETMQHMVAQGLIRSRTRAGTVVLPRSQWNLLDPVLLDSALRHAADRPFFDGLLAARRVMEPEAAALAAQAANHAKLVSISDALAKMVEANSRDTEAWSVADLAFHTAILDASGNWVFRQFTMAIRAALLASFRMTNRASQSHAEAIALHAAVFDAIKMRDPVGARAAMDRLIKQACDDIESVLRAQAF